MTKANITRTLIETTLNKVLRDIESDLARTIRNAVDFAEDFSKGRFQKNFFETAQCMLKNDDCAYYTLAQNTVSCVNHQTLKTFGINLGYNGCTNGAKLIRENEEKLSINIPWVISIHISRDGILAEDSDRIITQGKALGTFVYLFFNYGGLSYGYHDLMKKHADCAFAVFTTAEEVLNTVIDNFADLHNCMFSVHANSPDIIPATNELRENHFLYAVHQRYDKENIEELLSDRNLEQISKWGSTFSFLIPKPPLCPVLSEHVEMRLHELRESQRYPFFMLDLLSAVLMVDEIISEEPCSGSFGKLGETKLPHGIFTTDEYNILKTDLSELLKKASPKHRNK